MGSVFIKDLLQIDGAKKSSNKFMTASKCRNAN